jgi:ribosome biogenesis GTPase
VEERASVLSRADHLRRRSEQLIAANIDQVLITVSIAKPSLKHALVDRYLIAAEKGAMVPVIIVNKTDLLQTPEGSEERQFFEQFYHDYTSLGFQVIPVSVVTGEGLQELEAVMEGKASVFSGQSGVGKSSLINAIMGKDLPIGDIVLRTQKGSHTTTMTQLIPIARGGFCIDTPGIRSFGLWRLGVGETVGYFNEILIKGRDCKYAGCRHLEEPGCVVRESVEAGEISALRYDSYVKLVEEEESEWTK